MNLSMKWLKEFTDTNVSPREFAEAMTMSGSKVEGYEIDGDKINNVVVGRVLSLEKHPDADKLTVCMIDAGETEPLQIVTGASNLKVGDYIPVAKDNSTLYDGKKIKKGKLRGVLSSGMLCSLGELGLTLHDFPYAVEDGIFVLGDDCEKSVGTDICKAIGLDDTKVEFEITSNRPDCFSVIGLAREAAATFGTKLKLRTPNVKGGAGKTGDMLSAEVKDTELCPMYCVGIVKDVKVQPSPRWMRERLRAMGVRPINNIVDITNYVMLEYGQPMHAFDYSNIEGSKIVVRRAHPEEEIITLDGSKRMLSPKNLVIADAEKPVAVAGVMGGEYSGISDSTSTIVFESANFLGKSVRLTAKQLGMRTDSSSRFEKGLDVNSCMPALLRACELVEMLGAGHVCDDAIICSSGDKKPVQIQLDPDWINAFLGADIPTLKMEEYLTAVGCKLENGIITVPSFRPDLEHKADIAEEIARFYGYNNIQSSSAGGSGAGKYSERQKFDAKINRTMQALGVSEILTYSFISPKFYGKSGMPEEHVLRDSITISNPLGEDTGIMRTYALPSLLEILAKNYNARNLSASLYEIATEYIPTEKGSLPNEIKKLVCGFYGEGTDFFTVKGIVEELLEKAGLPECEYEAEQSAFSFHPGRCASVRLNNGASLGIFGEIHPSVAENYGIPLRVYAVYLDLDAVYAAAASEKLYTPLPRYPSVTRDLAVICDADMPVASLKRAVKESAGKLLSGFNIFDVYTGKQIEDGKKSVAFSITLQSSEETLTEAQVSSCVDKIMAALTKTGARLRG